MLELHSTLYQLYFFETQKRGLNDLTVILVMTLFLFGGS